MSNYKHYFSNKQDVSYNDYLKTKKGKEIIKKSISDNKTYINTFINYETFLILTKTFYENINNKYTVAPPVSITDSVTSHLNYKSVLAHVNDDDCHYCKTCENIESIFECKHVQNILYPYGNSLIKNDPNKNIFYPHNIDLSLYCRKCPYPCEEHCETIHRQKCDDRPSPTGCCDRPTPTGCCDRLNPTGCCNTCTSGNPYNYHNPCRKPSPLFFVEKTICKCSKCSHK